MTGKTRDSTESLSEPLVSRRRFLQASAGAAVAASATGVASAEGVDVAAENIDYSADITHAPWVTGTATVTETTGEMSQLEYVADDGSVASLNDDGIVIARRPDNDSDTPVAHNPVTLTASDIQGDEYTAFPRNTTYDHDNDTSTDEEPVEWHDAEHWTTTDATDGSISLTEGDRDSLTISASGMSSGETVTATFDLSTVGSSDATITDGMSRKFLQQVADVTSLPSGSSIDVALIDSNGTEVTASYDPSGDTANVDVLAASTGDAIVTQPRVGEIEDAQGVTLGDIQQAEVRINEADAALDLHALNVERETKWQYGDQEFVNADDELETETIEEPSGTFSIVSLSSLRENGFGDATIRNVEYDVEQVASELPSDATMVRERDADRYEHDHRVEIVHTFDGPSAYDLSRQIAKLLDTQNLPGSRYLTVETATGLSEDPFEDSDGNKDWDKVDDVSWTSKGSQYDSLDKEVEALAGLAVSDETIAIKLELGLNSDQFNTYFGGSGVAVGGAAGGGGLSGNIDRMMTVLMGVGGGLLVFFRKRILSVVR